MGTDTRSQRLVLFLIVMVPPIYVLNMCRMSQQAPRHPVKVPPIETPIVLQVIPESPEYPAYPPYPPPLPSHPGSGWLRQLTETELGWIRQQPPRLLDCLSLEEREGPHPSEFDKRPTSRAVPLYLVMQYPWVMDKAELAVVPYRVQAGRGQRGKVKHRPAQPQELERRQREYHYALARSLQHPQVAQLHLLLNRSSDLPRLLQGLGSVCGDHRAALPLRAKLRLRILGQLMTYGQALDHINRHLAGRHVMLLNSDIYPVGPGWSDLRPQHFGATNRSLFMLSRYSPPCPGYPDQNPAPLGPRPARSCAWAAGVGSADAFVFRAPVPQAVVDEMLEIPTNYWGAENRAAAALHRAGYRPQLNPCRQLAVWHEHCSRVRVTGAKAPRVNRGAGKSRTAPFLESLALIGRGGRRRARPG